MDNIKIEEYLIKNTKHWRDFGKNWIPLIQNHEILTGYLKYKIKNYPENFVNRIKITRLYQIVISNTFPLAQAQTDITNHMANNNQSQKNSELQHKLEALKQQGMSQSRNSIGKGDFYHRTSLITIPVQLLNTPILFD